MPFLTQGPEGEPSAPYGAGNTNWKFIGIVVVLAVIAGGGIWFLSDLEQGKPITPEKDLTEHIEEKTADWQTYRNEEYGFEIKYPGDWRQDDLEQYKLGIIFEAINYLGSFTVYIMDIPGDKDLNDYLREDFEKDFNKRELAMGVVNMGDQEEIELLGLPAIQREEFIIGKYSILATYLKNNNLIFKFSFYGREPLIYRINKEDRRLNDQIISTFRFIEQASKIDKQPYIKITSPSGGEEWKEGNIYEITWESRGIEKVIIELSPMNPERPDIMYVGKWIAEIDANLRKYSWRIPVGYIPDDNESIFKSGKARIIIYDFEDFTIFDKSEGYFTILEKYKNGDWKNFINKELKVDFNLSEEFIEIFGIPHIMYTLNGKNGEVMSFSFGPREKYSYTGLILQAYTPDYQPPPTQSWPFYAWTGKNNLLEACPQPLEYEPGDNINTEERRVCKIIEIGGQRAILEVALTVWEASCGVNVNVYFDNHSSSIYRGLNFILSLPDTEQKICELFPEGRQGNYKELESEFYSQFYARSSDIIENKNLSEKDGKRLKLLNQTLSTFKFLE